MKKRFLIIATLVVLLASCPSPSDKQPNNKPENPDQKTFIVFDNTQGICTVSVYDDYRRRNEYKIAEISARKSSEEINWTPGDSVPFYFSYRVTIKGINDFSLNYVPEIGRDQKQVRIDADVTTNIKIPALSETISSPDTLLSNNSYLLIQNNSSYPFRLHRGDSPIPPDNLPASLVNNGERAQYTINPGAASTYQLMVGADYKEFPGSIVNFEAGHIYYFEFNGSISLVSDTELKLININGIAIPQPPAAPVVIVSNGSLTLQWTAVESATAYEIWMSTANDSASASKYGTDIVASLTATISDLNNGSVYYIWIKAKNILGTSGFSPVATGIPSASTVKPPDPMTAPSIIAGNGQLSISWQAVEDTSVYEVWAGITNDIQTAKQGEDVSGLSTVISGLNNGTTYYVWIKAKNNIGVSGFSPPALGKPLGTPGMPTLSSGHGQLVVTWTAVAGADEYEVYYGIGTPTTLAVTTAETTATITGLTNGTSYYVRLRAKNVSGISDYGSSVSGVPIGNMGVVTVSAGDSQLSLSWAAVAGANQYEVYYSTTNSIPSNPTQTVSTNMATISGLTNGTTYYVWVKGKNANGSGNTSVAASGKPLGTPGMPTITPGYYGQLLVTWTAVVGADEYEVYYGIGTPTTLAATTAGTTATITELTSGTTYYVRLRAKNTSGVSDYGPTASGVPNTTRSPGLYRGNEKIGNQNLTASLTYISSNAVNGDDYYIVLGADESISPKTLIYSGKTVEITLLGSDGEKTLSLNSSSNGMFTVNSGVTMILEQNITIVGMGSKAPLVSVSGGNLIMNEGSKITGNRNSAIYANGGGLFVNSGTFIMNGGEISNNTASYTSGSSPSGAGGGVSVTGNSASFTMNGGKIKDNSAYYGGGVYITSGAFIMNGGEISSNIGYNGGGGVYFSGNVFTMSGNAVISGNTTYSYDNCGGGGVYFIGNGTFTMSGNAVISGNTACNNSSSSNGGGVYFSGNAFTMSGNAVISGNTVLINNNGRSFGGGGVYFSGNGTFTKSGGGTITGYSSDSVFGNVVKNGSSVVQSNRGHAVYVGSGKRRETTAGPGVNMDSNVSGAAGGWED